MLQARQDPPYGPPAHPGAPHAQLVGHAATRAQLHRRALNLLSSLQEGLCDFLSEVLPEAAGPAPSAHPSDGASNPTEESALRLAASAQALGISLPKHHVTNALLLGTQQRTDLIKHTFSNFDELFNGIEHFLADVLEAVERNKQQDGKAGQRSGSAGADLLAGDPDFEFRIPKGQGADLMKEAAATYAAAQRWQQRAADAQQAADTAQKQAWEKVRGHTLPRTHTHTYSHTYSVARTLQRRRKTKGCVYVCVCVLQATLAADLSSQATDADTQAELLRLQGKLPEAMLAIRKAGQ